MKRFCDFTKPLYNIYISENHRYNIYAVL
ncbi:uncharacterized protein METZ01_LOCUS35857 [marine metagenome]|uniref:Uncharacterized protein n=1 Tax=marine metagenome TaxID=408172 RepID=A0A381QZV2_9ZZZZ